jgi:hypothetical protein
MAWKPIIMRKILTGIILFFMCSLYSFSQGKTKYERKEINGYLIWEMTHDSLLNVYHLTAMYLNIDGNRVSINNSMTTIGKVCKNRKFAAWYRRSLRWKKDDPLDNYYHFYRDTSTITSSLDITVDGTFYKNDSGKLCLGYKVSAKVIIFDSLCSEFENSRRLRTRCGALFSGPYAYIFKTIRTENINIKDLENLNWSESRYKQIRWNECH